MLKKEDLLEILEEVGLSEKESLVYFSLISLGSATILQISRDTSVKRSTIYAIIESLKEKGLVKIELHGFKQKYVAENPKKLTDIYDNRKAKLENAMGEFASLYNLQGGESFISYYQGLSAIKNIYEGLLHEMKPKEKYLVIANQQLWYDLDNEFFQSFIERRAKLPIDIRLLLTDSQVTKEHQKYEKNYNESIKILPKKTFLNTDLVITPRKVVFHQLTSPIMAIVIENKSIIKMHEELFEIIWNSISK